MVIRIYMLYVYSRKKFEKLKFHQSDNNNSVEKLPRGEENSSPDDISLQIPAPAFSNLQVNSIPSFTIILQFILGYNINNNQSLRKQTHRIDIIIQYAMTDSLQRNFCAALNTATFNQMRKQCECPKGVYRKQSDPFETICTNECSI